MIWGISTQTAPTLEPITLQEALTHLRVDHGADNDTINALIKAARMNIETMIGMAIMGQSIDIYADEWPCDGIIELPRSNVTAITFVKYYDTNNTLTTIDSANYIFSSHKMPQRITPDIDYSWPNLYGKPEQIIIRVEAGYSTQASVPEPIKQAMKLLVGYLYENREEFQMQDLKQLPFGVSALLAPFTLPTWGY